VRRLRASDKAVSQKTYLRIDDDVPSWIGAIVAVAYSYPSRGSWRYVTGCLKLNSHTDGAGKTLLDELGTGCYAFLTLSEESEEPWLTPKRLIIFGRS
jgi:hypothetical protein